MTASFIIFFNDLKTHDGPRVTDQVYNHINTYQELWLESVSQMESKNDTGMEDFTSIYFIPWPFKA